MEMKTKVQVIRFFSFMFNKGLNYLSIFLIASL